MPMNQANSATQQVRAADNNTVTIDLAEVFGVLWHRLWLLVLTAAVCGTAAYCIARFIIPEQFESTTEIYILNKSDSNQNTVNYNDIQVGTQLTKDYSEMITSRKVLEQVISDLDLPYDYDTFKKKVEVTTPTDTRIVAITVTDTDPAEAQRMADEIRIDASQQIKDVMEIDAVNVVEEANFPTEKSSPINSRWAMIGALVGVLVVAAVIIVQYIMDDSIKTSDDVEKFLGLSTLALIPLDASISENSVEVTGRKRFRRKAGSDKGRGQEKRKKQEPDERHELHEQDGRHHEQNGLREQDRRHHEQDGLREQDGLQKEDRRHREQDGHHEQNEYVSQKSEIQAEQYENRRVHAEASGFETGNGGHAGHADVHTGVSSPVTVNKGFKARNNDISGRKKAGKGISENSVTAANTPQEEKSKRRKAKSSSSRTDMKRTAKETEKDADLQEFNFTADDEWDEVDDI